MDSKSPDLNVIIHLWDELNRCVKKRPVAPHNTQELQQSLVQERGNILQAFIQNNDLLMRQRYQQVFGARGGHTRPRGYKTFFMLNSTELKISTAHKN